MPKRLYHVHGVGGEDPTDGPRSSEFPHPPIQHEARIQALHDDLERLGLHPSHLPLGVLLDQDEHGEPIHSSACIRCNRVDGFPCLVNGKADAQVVCVDPAVEQHPNLTLMTNARVEAPRDRRRGAAGHGRRERSWRTTRLFASPGDVVVVSCGALNSALLLLGSSNDAHPQGLANGSDQVGRNYIRHNNVAVMALSRTPNPTRLQKTLALNDWYLKGEDWDYPWGGIQMLGKSDGEQLRAMAPRFLAWGAKLTPGGVLEDVARHGVDFWMSSEDLPRADSRITLEKDGTVRLSLPEDNNGEGLDADAQEVRLHAGRLRVPQEDHTSAGCISTRA